MCVASPDPSEQGAHLQIAMASYFSSLKLPNVSTSNLGSTLSERFQTVRKALTNSSETDDPDDPELSHISNVLRACKTYTVTFKELQLTDQDYTEKGRPFPPWLPPDPKAPPPPVIPQQPAYGAGYGYGQTNAYNNPSLNQRGPVGGRGGGLSDLWDSNPAAVPQPASQSLRAARTAGPRPSHIPSSSISSQDAPPSPERRAGVAPRPLPSQKAGSYQVAVNQSGAFNRGGSTGSTGSTSSAQERLRARLQGGGRESPTPPGSAAGGYGASAYGGGGGTGQAPYVGSSRPWDNGGGGDSFDSGYGSSGGRRAPPSGLPGNPRLGAPRGPR